MTPSAPDPANERRRRLWQRQAVFFGSIGLILVLTLVIAIAQVAGVLPSPFARDFTTPEETESTTAQVAVCPPADAAPVALQDVTVDVYNGTNRTGLAGTTAKKLEALGLKVGKTGNFDAGYPGAALIRVNPDQIVQGYTISRVIPNSVVALGEHDTAAIDVIIGEEFTDVAGADAIGKEPFAAPEGCETAPTPPAQ